MILDPPATIALDPMFTAKVRPWRARVTTILDAVSGRTSTTTIDEIILSMTQVCLADCTESRGFRT